MDSSDGESDFEGFRPEDINETFTETNNESDVDVSKVSSIDSDSENEEVWEQAREEEEGEAVNIEIEWGEANRPVRLQPFTQESGPNHGLADDATVLDYFKIFMDDDFFELVALETNRYAKQRIASSGKPDPLWKETDAQEMKAYFAINILMGLNPKPQLWCYWSTDEKFRCTWTASTMSQTRFKKLTQYLHICDTSATPARGTPGYDKLYKVRPLIDHLVPKLKENYNPSKNLSVDEAMIGFKGRLSFKQYMPMKPTRFGIKVWELCDSKSGYCCNFEIYTGKKEDNPITNGLGYDVVYRLSSPYHNQGHHLYFDR